LRIKSIAGSRAKRERERKGFFLRARALFFRLRFTSKKKAEKNSVDSLNFYLAPPSAQCPASPSASTWAPRAPRPWCSTWNRRKLCPEVSVFEEEGGNREHRDIGSRDRVSTSSVTSTPLSHKRNKPKPSFALLRPPPHLCPGPSRAGPFHLALRGLRRLQRGRDDTGRAVPAVDRRRRRLGAAARLRVPRRGRPRPPPGQALVRHRDGARGRGALEKDGGDRSPRLHRPQGRVARGQRARGRREGLLRLPPPRLRQHGPLRRDQARLRGRGRLRHRVLERREEGVRPGEGGARRRSAAVVASGAGAVARRRRGGRLRRGGGADGPSRWDPRGPRVGRQRLRRARGWGRRPR
jgi:hypothetical protein